MPARRRPSEVCVVFGAMRMTEQTKAMDLIRPQARSGLSQVDAASDWRSRLDDILKRLERLVPADSADAVLALKKELAHAAVRVSMVGQVKAGKTALTNALIGQPELLPSDVNPWTSVVTSVFINTPQPKGKDAVFTFFSTEEWDKMVEMGGHLGEMAIRANHRDELVELRKQIIAMQTRTKNRLGRNFDLLLDGYHSFLGTTPDMVKKYVCLGEEDENPEGRYADVTKSASLYIQNDAFTLPTVVSDTPGVNDPFLLRESVTLANLSETDICVVVLSAHQAFSSVDVSLLRILSSMNKGQLVIFINRIDELQDPDQQVIEIDEYVRGLLEEQDLSKDIPIVFGSAEWATATQTGEFENDHSLFVLESLVDQRAERLEGASVASIGDAPFGSTANTTAKLTDLSGLHELKAVIEEKSAMNVTRPMLERMQQQALDLSHQSKIYLKTVSDEDMQVHADLDFDAFFDELDTVLVAADLRCGKVFEDLTEKLLFTISNAFREYTHRETVALSRHLSNKKSVRDWRPDADQLRRALNLAHDDFANYAPEMINEMLVHVADQIEVIYTIVLDDEGELFAVRAPESPLPKPAASLMRTMAIDMSAGWLTDWFASRFKKDAYVNKFEEMCQAEMQETLKEMRATYISAFEKDVRGILHAFIQEHINTLQKLSRLGGTTERDDVLRKLGVDTEIQQRMSDLDRVVSDLNTLFDTAEQADDVAQQSVA